MSPLSLFRLIKDTNPLRRDSRSCLRSYEKGSNLKGAAYPQARTIRSGNIGILPARQPQCFVCRHKQRIINKLHRQPRVEKY
jgi:hypothetical protein